MTAGRLNPGPSSRELRERDLIARVKRPIAGCRRIAVVSRKGGVGKTTTALMLGHTFASYRGDRVIALDGNPDAGSLGYRVRRETTNTIMSLLAHRERIARYADIRAYTSQAPTRLEVVAAADDPRITDALRERDFYTAIDLLETHYNLVCMDTGTGVLESAAKGILRLADQIVVVTASSLDSARTASSTLDWLEENGHGHLVADAVAVINSVRPRSQLDLDRLSEHFAGRCRAVVRVPWDRHLDAGAESSLEQLRTPTCDAYLELAAAVADGFAAVPESERRTR
jgi:putative peptide zinc metalloprotease protein